LRSSCFELPSRQQLGPHCLNYQRRLALRALSTSTTTSNHNCLDTSEEDMGASGTQRVNTTERLSKLRELMKREGVDVWVVPSEDQRTSQDLLIWLLSQTKLHCGTDYSEYPAHCDERRAFISGFNGSAGKNPSFVKLELSGSAKLTYASQGARSLLWTRLSCSRMDGTSCKLRSNWMSEYCQLP
jgi:hypothetical protein